MQYLLYILAIPFLFINYKIIRSDLKEKKIPNKYLWYLLLLIPFYYSYQFFYISDINYLIFFWQTILALIISFILYSFWVWSAWDAKYLLILALFIPNIWIIPFIWNIALLTLLYLILYFIWFYFWKCLFNRKYAINLYNSVHTDLIWKFNSFIKHQDWNIYKKTAIYKLLKWFVLFLIIFVSFRLTRLYIIDHILFTEWQQSEWSLWKYFIELIIEYNVYYILIVIIWVFCLVFFSYKSILIIKKYVFKKITNSWKNNINPIVFDIILISILWLSLIFYIVIEFVKSPSEISHNLKLIFTFYLILYIMIKILIYSYHITFQLWEQDFIEIEKLKAWNILDKTYLINLFWEQSSLWYCPDNIDEKLKKERSDKLLYPNPKNYFLNLKNPIDNEGKNKILEIYNIVNDYHNKKSTSWFQKINSIKILKTFSFWWYIFIWFIITFLYWNFFFEYFIKYLLKYLKISPHA